MVHAFSNILSKIFDVIVIPFGSNRTAALWGISLLAGIALIYLFKATSDQKRIKATRDAFKGRILEMRIYQDDIVLILKALAAALWTNVTYLRASLKPILVLFLVALPIFIQLDERFGREYLQPGDTALLTVTLKDGVDLFTTPITADGGDAVLLDSPPVRVVLDGEINWRVKVTREGVHPFTVTVYDTPYEFPVTAEISNKAIAHTRTANSVMDPFLHPSMPVIPKNSAIQAVTLTYGEPSYSLIFWQAPWWVVFLVLLSLGALIPKFLFGIEI